MTDRGLSDGSFKNEDLLNIEQWLLANKLSLNATKTEHMFISSEDNVNKIENTSPIHISQSQIKNVSSTKCLGVQIDQKLSWMEYVDQVSNVAQEIAELKTC